MIVVDKKNIVMGSNAVKSGALPKQNPEIKRSTRKKQEQHAYTSEHKAYKRKRNVSVFSCLIFFFLLGMITVGRTNALYQNQKQIETLKQGIKDKEYSLDAMKLEGMGLSLKELGEKAEKYNMQAASKDDFVNIDLSKNYFAVSNMSQTVLEKGFFTKLVELLF